MQIYDFFPIAKEKSGNGAKVFGIITLIIAILGLAAVIVFYILFGMPKDNYKDAASDSLVAPTVTSGSTGADDVDIYTTEETDDE